MLFNATAPASMLARAIARPIPDVADDGDALALEGH
jgi:hypothetical protein